jgi:hypothetical protein
MREIARHQFARRKQTVSEPSPNGRTIAHNLFLNCANVGIDTASGLGAPRPVRGHTLDVRGLNVHGNIFSGMGRSAIEFTNAHNRADGNVYARPTGNELFAQPFLRVKFPEPPEWHDLASWREQHGWDEHGGMADITAEFDPDTLQLTLTVEGELQSLPPLKGLTTDFHGRPVPGDRVAGPFTDLLTHTGPRNIDPR